MTSLSERRRMNEVLITVWVPRSDLDAFADVHTQATGLVWQREYLSMSIREMLRVKTEVYREMVKNKQDGRQKENFREFCKVRDPAFGRINTRPA